MNKFLWELKGRLIGYNPVKDYDNWVKFQNEEQREKLKIAMKKLAEALELENK